MKKAFEFNDLIINPSARVPVCLCLDMSGSMNASCGGVTKLKLLEQGLRNLYEDLKNDENARNCADISIVTFNNDAQVVEDFSGVRNQPSVHNFVANGMTEMGKGVNKALSLLDIRQDEYRSSGREFYKPWLFLMTDGNDNGDSLELQLAQKDVNNRIKNRQLTFIPVGFGDKSDFSSNNKLNNFSDTVKAIRYDSIRYADFFKWISKSIIGVSNSRTTEDFTPDSMPNGWEYMG